MDIPTSFGPPLQSTSHIEHYYGDSVRQLFLVAAVITLLSIPFYAELIPYTAVVEILAVAIVAIFAALTNPFKKWILIGDALIATLGLLVFETAAVSAYIEGAYILFMAREALALVFLFALYFSVKTVRAMWLHQLGKRIRPADVIEEDK